MLNLLPFIYEISSSTQSV